MPSSLSVQVDTYFSPWDDTTGKFLEFVQGTQQSLFVCIYGFHLPKLTDMLIDMHTRGIELGLILDHSQAAGVAERGEVDRLVKAGVPLLVGTSPVKRAIVHNKFAVRDGCDVEYGSWNYSLSASDEGNDLHIVTGAPAYAAGFLHHYHRLHGFIVLHEMMYQPAGAVVAPDAPDEEAAQTTVAADVKEKVAVA